MQSLIPLWCLGLMALTIFIILRLQHIINQSDHCQRIMYPYSRRHKSSSSHPDTSSYSADEFKDAFFAPVLEAYQKASEHSYVQQPQRRFRSGHIPNVVMYVNKMYVDVDWYYMHMLDIMDGQCPLPCTITPNISQVKTADAVLIHLLSVESPDTLSKDLGTRDPSQPWIMFEPETHLKGNVMFYNDYKSLNGIFNRTMHYRQDSDILLLHGFIVRRGKDASLLPPTWRRQPELRQNSNTRKLAVAFVSNCHDDSGRLKYIEALKTYAPIDVYGKCGDKKCGHSLYTHQGYRIDEEPCMRYAGQNYLFYLAFENALCKDYVTEKLYNLLYYPLVPVVLGEADYSVLLPPHSYINARHYTPQQLAQRLQHLANHPKV
ncbi:alpha-(1,3)-fucosyltransferase C-like [Panulirus ornatus]|uniref:alpha-(1,3)-fucosyltransferase C-like n=1 Tax=Panulirus ornatus TaxID=150431 RepID=UPI003A869525